MSSTANPLNALVFSNMAFPSRPVMRSTGRRQKRCATGTLHVRARCATVALHIGQPRGEVMEDRIEQQITINAPLDRVWKLVSEPGWWVPSKAVAPIDHTPGHQVVRESDKWGRYPVEVVRVEPQTYAAFRWASQAPGEELRD